MSQAVKSFVVFMIGLFLCVVVVGQTAVLAQPDPGQSAVSATAGTINLARTTFATGLNGPVSIATADDGSGRLFVVEQDGIIRIVEEDGTVLPTPFLDIRTRVDSSSNEEGLLGLAFHPDYRNNGEFYVNYTNTITNIRRTRISLFTVTGNPDIADPNSEDVLLTVVQDFSNHNAGDIHFGFDGYLYIPLGDGGSGGDPNNRAQDPTRLLGKITRIDVDSTNGGNQSDCNDIGGSGNYTIPADNPYVGVGGVCDLIWAMGLRNPWRSSIDRLTGDRFIGDVGQNTWEEVSYEPITSTGGVNFGWRCYEGDHPYNTSGCGPIGTYTFPIFEYNHSDGCSITGGYVYRGTQYPAMHGRYLVTDYCSGNFWDLVVDDTRLFTSTMHTNLTAFGYTAFGEASNCELYLANSNGTIYHLEETSLAAPPAGGSGLCNYRPAAGDDAYSTPITMPLQVTAPGVLLNDSDLDGDPLMAVLDTPPFTGTLVFTADGAFDYIPSLNFQGVVTFTYHAEDGFDDSRIATVFITVTGGNIPPVAVADLYTTTEDIALNVPAPGVLTNDSDADGDPLTAVLDTTTANGTLTLNGDGSFSYIPDANFNGTDLFTYHARDGMANSETVAVTIAVTAVNDPPVAVDDAYPTLEDVPLNVPAPGVLTNDSDADGDLLTAVLETMPSNGSFSLNSDGSFSYTPDTNFYGVDTFTYHADDGTAASNTATVTLTVAAVNDPPVAVADTYTTTQDTVLTVAAPGVLDNDVDVEGDALTAVLGSAPMSGTLALLANGSFSYTPNAGFTGTDSFTYSAYDGSDNSEPVVVTLNVVAGNAPPIALSDHYSTSRNVVLAVPAPGVLTNDSDPNGDALTAVLSTPPFTGSLLLNGDGSFVYTPTTDFVGTVNFTYRAFDGTSSSTVTTVTLEVLDQNVVPVAVNDAYTVTTGFTLTVAAPGVLANDSDANGDVLTAVLDTPPVSGTVTLNADGSFVYTPTAGFSGVDTFFYYASDGIGNSGLAMVTITVTPAYRIYLPFIIVE